MKTILSYIVIICMLVCYSVAIGIEEKFKKDIFNILTGVTIETRDAKGSPVVPENITYYYFTKENPSEFVTVSPQNIEPINDPSAHYVFIIHGWTENREVGWYEDMKNAFLNRQDEKYNVIQVDWSAPANELYSISATNTKDVGTLVGEFIVKLYNEKSIPIENFHLVGHSLGGQVSGFAGKKVYKETGKKLPRITALDPAGPLFTGRPLEERLNKDDAEVVAVIHTDGGKFGFQESTGTVDFFPNGGSDQPGCTRIDLLDITSVAEPVYCDHQRSWRFFIEAVLNPDKFISKKCTILKKLLVIKTRQCDDNDTVNIGDFKTKKFGNYYLVTNSETPFGKPTGIFDITKLIPSL